MPSAPSGSLATRPPAIARMRVEVGRQVAPRIGLGARAFAEHVVAEAQLRRRLALGPRPAPIASWMLRPSTNWRPSSCTARTVAATTVCAPSRLNRPLSASASGRNFFDSAMALADRLASILCGPPEPASNAALPSWSAVSAIAVSVSGTRSSASARRISASPSALEIGYSRSSDSMAQNGGGLSRTACTQGRARRAADGQSNPLPCAQRLEQRQQGLRLVAIGKRQAGGGRWDRTHGMTSFIADSR